MWFYQLAIFVVLISRTIAAPAASSFPGNFGKLQQLTIKTTCDQLPETPASPLFTPIINWLSPQMTDDNCTDYGQDHIVFNRTTWIFGDLGPGPVKNHA
ncbi:hypothetical protein MFRU_022g00060 [Monilinia fructicola]|nr:hypothetical protein MFRU_022g00060 [Monilinia fructicola]